MCVTYKKFCCCCCNVVTCSKVHAILGLIVEILSVISEFLSLTGTATFFGEQLIQIPFPINLFAILGYSGLIWATIVIDVVGMIADVLLLIGISKKKPGFMMVSLIIKMILLVVS